MFPIWTQVKVKTDTHPRFEEAGVVDAINPAKPDERVIRFDKGGVEAVAVADLQELR